MLNRREDHKKWGGKNTSWTEWRPLPGHREAINSCSAGLGLGSHAMSPHDIEQVP